MSRVKAPSGHVLTVDDSLVDFWVERGYRLVEDAPKAPAEKKAPAKRAAAKSDKK